MTTETKEIQKPTQQISDAPEKEVSQLEKLFEELLEKKANLTMTRRGFEPGTMEEAWRFANALSESGMIPDRYKGEPRDCLVVLDLAARLGCSWLAVMQHVYSVHGRVSMESVLVIALVNQSGLFVNAMEYEAQGNVSDPNYKVRATAKRKSTGTVLYGPWIDWKLVKSEGWDVDKKSKTSGYVQKSKWNTMPEQMFHYRAASWFQRRHCPEVTMGMLTTSEASEIGPTQIAPQTFDQAQTEATEQIKKESGSEIIEVPLNSEKSTGENGNGKNGGPDFMNDEEPDPETKAKAEKEKKKLAAAEKKKAKKNKDAVKKYHCDKGGTDFDEPNATDAVKGSQCPDCFSWNTHVNENWIDPDIREEP